MLAPQNQLFQFVVQGLIEAELIRVRSVAIGVMDRYAKKDVAEPVSELPENLWEPEAVLSIRHWLTERQAHLNAFAVTRVPATQGELFR